MWKQLERRAQIILPFHFSEKRVFAFLNGKSKDKRLAPQAEWYLLDPDL